MSEQNSLDPDALLKVVADAVANASPETLKSLISESLTKSSSASWTETLKTALDGTKLLNSSNSQSPAESLGDPWEQTLKNVIKSVVSIHFAIPFSTDVDGSMCSEATGFLVDAERGIILTNRHVVTTGPFYGFAIFHDHEEVKVTALHRDPVHDFGFLKFDVTKRRGELTALRLAPEKAVVGREIRLVGNDAGEKISILSGTISRVDRNAPDYGEFQYTDFNSAYIQASAAATGGSSGSPVVDQAGEVLAMQAGGMEDAATDYFIPLDRAKRALELLQAGKPVSRGTLLIHWELSPYDECRRLGLSEQEEETARKAFPNGVGLLVAKNIVPQDSDSESKVVEGDVLISINGVRVTEFLIVDEMEDSNIGNILTLGLQRAGKTVSVEIEVKDLADYTPSQFLRAGEDWFSPTSFQLVRAVSIPIKGFSVESPNYLTRNCKLDNLPMLWELDGKTPRTIRELGEICAGIPDQRIVKSKFVKQSFPRKPIAASVSLQREFNPDVVLATRNDKTGLFDFEVIEAPQTKPEQMQEDMETQNAVAKRLPEILETDSSVVKSIKKFARYMVMVNKFVPYHNCGEGPCTGRMFGLVLSLEKGLVIVPTSFLSTKLAAVWVTVGSGSKRRGKVEFIHPQHGYALIKCDLSGALELEDIPLSTEKLNPEEKLHYVWPDAPSAKEVTVSGKSAIGEPYRWGVPSYSISMTELISFKDEPQFDSPIGALLDPVSGSVKALRLGSARQSSTGSWQGCNEAVFIEATDLWLKDFSPKTVNITLSDITMPSARDNKLPEEWCHKFESTDFGLPRVYAVDTIMPQYADLLEDGDILLEVNNVLFRSASQLTNFESDSVQALLCRDGKVIERSLPTADLTLTEISTIIHFGGMIVQNAHRELISMLAKQPKGVLISDNKNSGPSSLYNVDGRFITHVDGNPTPDVEAFWREISKIGDETYVRLRVLDMRGSPCAASMRTNYWYFPSWRRDLQADGTWSLEKGHWPSGFSVV